MTTKELLYVKTVADEHNISKAAKKLFMAQPSLSQSIQRIEESIGMPLFHRTTTGLTLTFAGERYYHMAVQVLKMYEDFQLEISDINNLKTGRIHIGITNHLGTLVLPRVLPAYKNICPHVEITIHEENTAALEQQLLAGKLDFAVMHAPPEKSSLSALRYELLSRDPFILVLSPEHPLLQKAVFQEGYPYPVLDLKLLAREPFLMLHQTQRIRQITDEVLLRAGISRPQTVLTLRSFETAQLLAARGMGVMLVPEQYSRIHSGQLQPARLCIDQAYGAGWDMCIATLGDGFLSKADQLFIRILKEQFPTAEA